ncbi:hypothetical protein TELCIR_03378 [Teladorsagia circumcincta]|uniref:Reverse transcriptase domain-containing protein n=1 Tax=Teladorsagia circumcincta TaxID=45464 RepID=A0A2G9UY12_TELCI|nr:hypothetical protein TELCIR_03378 [Teladorsagia circumcincta]
MELDRYRSLDVTSASSETLRKLLDSSSIHLTPIFTELNGGRYFSQLDPAEAYLQSGMNDDSEQLLTIIRFNRLQFGVEPALGIFQQYIHALIAKLDGTAAYLGDVLVTGSTIDEHNSRIEAVFPRFQDYGFSVRLEKCNFLQTLIKYLGFDINEQGRCPELYKLTHFDPNLTISVAADASSYGMGVILSHGFPYGRTTARLRRKPSLAVQTFHRLVHGRHSTLKTDHKPLVAIFGNKKGVHVYNANRLQQRATMQLNYDYAIECVNTKNSVQVNALSRFIASRAVLPDGHGIANIDVKCRVCQELPSPQGGGVGPVRVEVLELAEATSHHMLENFHGRPISFNFNARELILFLALQTRQ